MSWLAGLGLLGLIAGAGASGPGGAEPSVHTLTYYNARLALREDQPLEAVKLWLLRNATEELTGRVSPHDEDFRSVTWAALGELGVCQDNLSPDGGGVLGLDDVEHSLGDGVGLWPLAMHNWVVRNKGRRSRGQRPRSFDAFQVDRQARVVSITDVLGSAELESVRLFRGGCLRPRLVLISSGEVVNAELSDRQVAARFLRYLLERGKQTLDLERVRGWAVLEARLFDLDLQLAELAAREARQAARERARRGGAAGLSRESVQAMTAAAPRTTLDPDSEAARVLRECVDWPASEWQALEPQRRRFLFDEARAWHAAGAGGEDWEWAQQVVPLARFDDLALRILDRMVAAGEGGEAEEWVARVGEPEGLVGTVPVDPRVWSGERGAALLALDDASGFRERGVVALHRGVDHLQRGELDPALRALAYALQHAPESREAEAVAGLSRRWISYVAARFELTDALLLTLQELVPRRDYSVILEDLMWRAAFHADAASYERGLRNQLGRGALERRLALLEPLSRGEAQAFVRQVDARLDASPSEALRFLGELVERLEREDAAVRGDQLGTARALRRALDGVTEQRGASSRQQRTARELSARLQAIEEGLVGLGVDATVGERARALAPGGEVFAGSVRLAPVDPLPWPFRPTDTPAPSIFEPLELRPVEWRDEGGELVLGWSIGG